MSNSQMKIWKLEIINWQESIEKCEQQDSGWEESNQGAAGAAHLILANDFLVNKSMCNIHFFHFTV